MVYNIVMHYTFDVFTMTLFTNLLTTSSSTWNCCNFHCNWLFLLCTFNALITNRTWIPFFLITKDIFREGSVKLNSKILFHVSFFGCFTQTMQRVNTTGVFFFLQKAGAGYTMLAAFIPAWTISRVCIEIIDWGT